jgi:phytoene dehydrogenase-like protein
MEGIEDIESEIETMLARMYEHLERIGEIDEDAWRRVMDLASNGHDRASVDARNQPFDGRPDPCLAATLYERARRLGRLHDLLKTALTAERRKELLQSFGPHFSMQDVP